MRASRMAKLRFCLALVASSLALNVAVSAERKDFEFKGFIFGGTTISEWRKAVHEVGPDMHARPGKLFVLAPYCEEEGRNSSKSETALGIRRCSWYTPVKHLKSLAVGQASTNYDEWVFVDGVLTSFLAEMYVAQMPNLLPPLQAKYGAPSRVQTQKLRNAFGAEFTNYIYEWQLGSSMQITVTKYSGDLTTSSIVISNPALSKELKRRKDSTPVDKSGL